MRSGIILTANIELREWQVFQLAVDQLWQIGFFEPRTRCRRESEGAHRSRYRPRQSEADHSRRQGVQRISMSTDGSRVFTHDQGSGRIASIDTATHKVARWIDIPDYAYVSTPTPDGRWLLAGLRRANRIVALDMQTLKVAKSFDSRWSDRTATSPSSPAYLRGKSRSSICAPGGCSPRST